MNNGSTKTLRVRDIMTREVITLVGSTSLEDAARSLTFHKVSGAPVMEHGRIVGVVSKTDLVDPRHRPSATGDRTVADAMTPVIYAVRPGDPALSAVRLMVEEGVHRVVVVDDNRRLAGIVSTMDVMRALASGARIQDEQEWHGDPAVAVEYVDLRVS